MTSQYDSYAVTVVGVDADDTLWPNMPYYIKVEERFCRLLRDFADDATVTRELAATEAANIPLYGYGVKGHTLSMIETAARLTEGTLDSALAGEILRLGKSLLAHPVKVLDGVVEALTELGRERRLVVATKGDLLDQERKLQKSGLLHFFHHIEIMSDKTEEGYARLLRHLDIRPAQFAMVGNSVKSDILPVLSLGGYGIHVPFPVTWEHEEAEAPVDDARFFRVESISEVPKLPLFRHR